MKVKVLREFIAGVDTFHAGKPAELPDDVAKRVIAAGWAEAPAPDWPKKLAGGYYELSSGEKVKGKDKAAEAQKALDTKDPEDPEDE